MTLARSLGSGAVSLGGVALSIRVMSVATQIWLGFLLTPSEFGLYAVALSFSALTYVIRDLGLRTLVVQRGVKDWAVLRRPAFDVVLATSWILFVVTVLAARPLEQVMGLQGLSLVLVVSALQLLPTAFITINVASLQMRYQFNQLGAISLVSALTRYASLLLLAGLGFGAVSFAVGAVAGAVAEAAIALRLGGERPLRSDSDWGTARRLVRDAQALILGTVGRHLPDHSDYAVLSLFLPVSTVGAYYFAYQMSIHLVSLAAVSLLSVLLPGLTSQQSLLRLRSERALVHVALIGCPAVAVVAVAAPSGIEIIWGQRWLSSAAPAQWFAIFLPLHLLGAVADSALQAAGRFGRWAWWSLGRGFGVPVAAFAGGLLFRESGDLFLVAGIVGGYIGFSTLLYCLRVVAKGRTLALALMRALVPTYGAVVVGVGVTYYMATPASALLAGITAFVATWLVLARVFTGAVLSSVIRMLTRRDLAERQDLSADVPSAR